MSRKRCHRRIVIALPPRGLRPRMTPDTLTTLSIAHNTNLDEISRSAVAIASRQTGCIRPHSYRQEATANSRSLRSLRWRTAPGPPPTPAVRRCQRSIAAGFSLASHSASVMSRLLPLFPLDLWHTVPLAAVRHP
jgi:hypothetical protein